ncbi:MAG: response regulator [Acidobacteriota bacterium]
MLIADEVRPFRDRLFQAVQQLGWSCALVEDGESALGYVQEHRPRLLLVNVYLRKLLGISVCERVKVDPQLQATKVILIGALFRQDRFVRPPEHLYGADGYIEEAIEPAELRQRLVALMGADSAASAAAPVDDSATPSPASDSGAPPPPEDLLRLIRIILSDIVVYNQDRVETALQSGHFTQEFKGELEEGRRLVLGRFPGLPCAEEIYRQGVERWVEERRRTPVS